MSTKADLLRKAEFHEKEAEKYRLKANEEIDDEKRTFYEAKYNTETKIPEKKPSKPSEQITGLLCRMCPDFSEWLRQFNSDIEQEKRNVPDSCSTVLERLQDKPLRDKPVSGNGNANPVHKEHAVKHVTKVTVKPSIFSTINCPERKRHRMIKGFIQSKKTWMQMAIALYYLLVHGISVIILVENKECSLVQLITRFKKEFEKIKSGLDPNFPGFESLIKVLNVKRGKKSSRSDIHSAMNGTSPRIFVSLRNKADLKTVNDNISSASTKRYVLIIDESDANDTNVICPAQIEMNRLKKHALLVWNVTATPLTTLMKDDIESGLVFVMNRPEMYKDFSTIRCKDLPLKAEACNSTTDDPFVKDPNLTGYLSRLSKLDVFDKSHDPITVEEHRSEHPVISLVRIGASIEPQLKIAEYCMRKYKNELTIVTYNGEGITLRGNGISNKPIKIGKYMSTCMGGVHKLTCDIGSLLSYLQSGGVKQFPRIVILAGKLADRGITFCASNYQENGPVSWHLSEMYYVVSNSANQPNILQGLRLCGIYRDAVPLTLFTNAGEDIRKAWNAQEELIARTREIQGGEEKLMRELLPSVPLSKKKCCKGRKFTNSTVPFHVRKVDDDSKYGGWKLEEYGMKSIRENVKENMDYIRRAYNNPTQLVHQIVSAYVSRGFESMTVSELKNLIGKPNLVIQNYTQWDLHHNRYRMLAPCGNNKYEIIPEVIRALNLD